MGASTQSGWVRFGEFSLHLTSGELHKAGAHVRLAHQPARLLTLLAARAGELVTREEIAAQIWGRDTFVDYDQSVNAAIRQVRMALSDDAERPAFIETVPKRGYRFIAPVIVAPGAVPHPPAPDHRLWRRRDVRAALVGLLGLLILAVAFAWRSSVSQVPSPRGQMPRAAQEAYLRGRYHLHSLTRAGDEEAITYFNQAIAADPDNAPAYVGVAEAQIALTALYRAPLETMPAARAAAEQAIALDPNLSDAHATLGTIKLMYDWDWDGAAREFRRAILLNPSSVEAHIGYSQYFTATAQPDAAIREARVADTLDPLNVQTLWNFYASRHYADAVREAQALLDLRPDFGWGYGIMALSYAGEGRARDAMDAADRGRALSDAPMVRIARADVYAGAGRRDVAEQTLAQLTAPAQDQYVCGVQLATLYAALGLKNEAFDSLERAFRQRSD